ncbi:MAG: hypothetical protein Fur0035_18930 [Anaerolineales bacterium]
MNDLLVYIPLSELLQQLRANNRLRMYFVLAMAGLAFWLHGFGHTLLWGLTPVIFLALSAASFDFLYRALDLERPRNRVGLVHLALTQSALDLILLTASTYFSGGALSPLPVFLVVYLSSMAGIFPPRYLIFLTALILTLELGVMSAYAQGWLTPFPLKFDFGIQPSPALIYDAAFFYLVTILANSFFASIQSRHAYRRWKRVREQELFLGQMQEITRVSLLNAESGDTYAFLATQVRAALGADCVYLTRVDEETGEVFSLAASDENHYHYLALPPNPRNENTFTASVIRLARPVIAEDALCSPYVSARVALTFPHRSIFALPLQTFPQEKFLGAMLVAFTAPRHYFGPEARERALQAADLAALLISRARLQRETQRRADLLEKFASQVSSLTSDLQQTTLLPAIVESARSLLGAQRAALHLMDSASHQMNCQYSTGLSAEYLEQMTRRFNQTAIAHALVVNGQVLIPDVRQDSRTSPIQDLIALEKFRAYGVFSLQGAGGQIGALSLYWDKPHAISAEEISVARLFAQRASSLLHHAQLYARVSEDALTDVLTGIANRRALDLRLEEECQRGERPFSLLMMDLDGFKGINDTFGHAIGDSVLQQVARLLQSSIRSSDTVFRFGGDEFSVILMETDLAQAVFVAEKLNNNLSSASLHLPNETQRFLTSCIGVASFPTEARDVKTLMEKADLRMYRAKRKGGAAIIASD